jgi:glycerol-3-phosphate acyltransferase PlsY
MTAELGMVLLAYLVGSVSSAQLVGKFTGRDPRALGTRNPGAANVFRHIGKGWGILVGCFDIGKGFLPVYLARFVLGLSAWWVSAAALATIVGHNWPVFFRFRGGKGLATSIGATGIISPLGLGIAMAVGVAVGLAISAFPAISGYKIPGGATGGFISLGVWAGLFGNPTLLFYALTATALILIRELPNITAHWMARC